MNIANDVIGNYEMIEFKSTDKWYKDAADSETGYVFNICRLYPPKDAGVYIINENLHFNFYKKPNLFHRWMTRLLLGWTWKDNI